MAHLRLVSKACCRAVDEHRVRLSLNFETASDCRLGSAFLQRLLFSNKNITILNLSILPNKPYDQGIYDCSSDSTKAAEREDWYKTCQLPLQVVAAADQLQKLTALRLWIDGDHPHPLELFTVDTFPNLQLLLLSGAISENLRLEIPSLSTLKFRSCFLSPKNMNEILCNATKLPKLADLEFTAVECDDWRAFEIINHTNLKHLRISLEDHHPKFIYYLQLGIEKSLQSLEGLYLNNCDVPLEVDPLGSLFNNEEALKNLKYLSLVFNWDLPGSDTFIKIARACPDLELLELGDWFYETREEAIDDDLILFEQRIVKYFDELAEGHTSDAPLLSKIKRINFVNVWSPDDDVPGISRVLCDHAKKLWPKALICGDHYEV